MSRTPTPRLLAGLGATLIAVAVFSLYTLREIEGLRALQTNTIERNRKDSLQLLRIQNDLNSIGLAIRDILEGQEEYPVTAYRGEFERLRYDLADAVKTEKSLSVRPSEQNEYLERSLRQFWANVDEVFEIAAQDQTRARGILANSLTAQQASLSNTVARLLVQNHEAEEQATSAVQRIYAGVERNIYIFLFAMLGGIALIGIFVAVSNRRTFHELEQVSIQRSTLSRRLIGLQEEIFRSVSRELHDDFGQILTAIGMMLRRAEKKDSGFAEDIAEVRTVAQEALEKTRSFSQALHPTILDDYGLDKAIERYLPSVEKQSGLQVHFERDGSGELKDGDAIHIYRILQEALNNVVKHSQSKEAYVRLRYLSSTLQLEIEDHGVGCRDGNRTGLGLIAMRERAQLVGGHLTVSPVEPKGTCVRLTAPLQA